MVRSYCCLSSSCNLPPKRPFNSKIADVWIESMLLCRLYLRACKGTLLSSWMLFLIKIIQIVCLFFSWRTLEHFSLHMDINIGLWHFFESNFHQKQHCILGHFLQFKYSGVWEFLLKADVRYFYFFVMPKF